MGKVHNTDRFVSFTQLLPGESDLVSPFRDEGGEVFDLGRSRGVAVKWPDNTVTIERMEAGVLRINIRGVEIQLSVTAVKIDASKLNMDLLEPTPPADAVVEPADAIRCPRCNGLMVKNTMKLELICKNTARGLCRGRRPL